jgi:hypothetical protein
MISNGNAAVSREEMIRYPQGASLRLAGVPVRVYSQKLLLDRESKMKITLLEGDGCYEEVLRGMCYIIYGCAPAPINNRERLSSNPARQSISFVTNDLIVKMPIRLRGCCGGECCGGECYGGVTGGLRDTQTTQFLVE